MTRSSDSNTVKLNKAYLSTMDFWYELLFSKAILPKHRYTLDHISNTIHVRRMLGIQIYKRYLKQDSQLFRDRKFFPFGGSGGGGVLIINQFKEDLLMQEELN